MAVELCLLLLLFCGSTISEVQPIYKPPPGTLDFGFVPAKTYDTGAYHEPGPIGILFKVVHAFLYLVQPNPFPQDLIRKLAQQKFGNTQGDYQKPENVVLTLQAIYYEIGFIVSAALGLLFILLLPLVGLCFCMCRCCDNCGGEMHQRQKKNADCQRSCFATFLFVASLIISVGVLCAYAANQHLTSQVRGAKKLVNSNFKDLKVFLNDTPAQIDYLVSQYNTTKDKALSDLNNVGPLLGSRVQEQLGKEVRPALDAALTMAGAIRETKEALENVSVSVEVLQEGTERLHANLTDVKMHLSNTLNDSACAAAQAASTCNIIRNSLNQLNINANFSGLPGVSSQLAKVNDVLKIDLSSLVQKGYAAFNDTPDLVVNQTKNILSAVPYIKNVLESIGSNISNFTKTLPVQKIIADLTIYLTQSEAYVQDYFPVVEQYDFYRWLGCLILCCMVVLIVIFYYLGLLCGTCGYDKHASPTTRGCISNTGGNFLMAGVGFSFLFSWVLMIVVVLTFVTGGNIEKLVCEPFEDKTLFKVLDTPYLLNQHWKNYLSGILFKNPNINLTFEKVYSDCKENKGIYTSLHLEHLFNINEFLNISMYTEDVALRIEHIQINLSKIILLDEIGKENLLNFSSSGIEGINFGAYLTEINKSVTKVDLLSFANDLEARADQLPKGALENALKGHANNIRMIHSQQVVPLEQAMKYVKARSTLNQSIRLLKRTSSELMVKVKNVISAVNAAQLLINNNASLVIVQETKKYMDTIVGYFEQYIEWVKESIAMEVAACKPIANVIDTAVDIFLCSYVTDSVNTFWFGLGGSSIFLIPAIIFAVKLSKYYRRMDTEDVYDDVETIPLENMENGNNGYHKEHLYGIHNPVITSSVEQW
ncbi:prominin-1 isoform X1 [Gallus gallus]|uniref:prominin-1 isoform X1 n=1 Tax=Gallus gallus TaxID=9031 RepID=UPI000739BDFC|nr:prominin-1 isoform X1 [Gallus gallus]XP_025005468.1 prominin-1 isoform X1 [Gallus gallus]XP_040554962.1 prominin-1 isoform X1 [Gallus gallus]XP_046772239.1 prominin-1 isoform X1 [Gallus gallus]XP_046772240.1 prominin-1 isoform X1 [Gallus gallus]XP_046772241.1 prominin-1 isoform X1 [Gallus gallus]|eukprot:XP_015141225.1 prominin-1 isoform X1 [Gallus gallus]